MSRFTSHKITRTPYFTARNASFSEAFLRFDTRNFAKNPHFALEIQHSLRLSWGLIWSHISGQKTACHTGNSRAKRIAGMVKNSPNPVAPLRFAPGYHDVRDSVRMASITVLTPTSMRAERPANKAVMALSFCGTTSDFHTESIVLNGLLPIWSYRNQLDGFAYQFTDPFDIILGVDR